MDVYVMPEGALYWYGNECNDITGGWSHIGYDDTAVTSEVGAVKNANNIQFYGTANSSTFCGTVNTINLSQYQNLKAIVNAISTYSTYAALDFYSVQNKIFNYQSITNVNNIKQTGISTNTLDVSDYNDNRYVVFSQGGMTQYKALLYAVWLE